MGVSTRPTRKHHQAAASLTAGLVVFLLLDFNASANIGPDNVGETTEAIAPAPISTAISTVSQGQEELELSGRYAFESDSYADAIDWQIKDATGETLFQASSSVASFKLSPGSYRVTANYGTVKIDEAVTLPAQTRLAINFVLNAGALRILPRVKGVDVLDIESESLIFALNGPARGKLVAKSRLPGEVIKLAAGAYRVESRFDNGNSTAVTDVDVKAGVRSAVTISHKAAVAHLSLLEKPTSDVQWTITSEDGSHLLLNGAEKSAALMPGIYVVEAVYGTTKKSLGFKLHAGERAEIVLGP